MSSLPPHIQHMAENLEQFLATAPSDPDMLRAVAGGVISLQKQYVLNAEQAEDFLQVLTSRLGDEMNDSTREALRKAMDEHIERDK